MFVPIDRRKMWLWRALDDEGEFRDVLVQKRRKAAALKLLCSLLRDQGIRLAYSGSYANAMAARASRPGTPSTRRPPRSHGTCR